ncbi:MAG: 2-aminoethylphosphonate--pyruvate transaminase [Planctomycetaceae bacterium]
MDDDCPYLLLTPGPLTTTRSVRSAMLRDVSTWDNDYNSVVQDIRGQLTALVDGQHDCTCVLMQGSGTFGVEATIGSVLPRDGQLLVVNNGAYGARMVQIGQRLGIPVIEAAFDEIAPASPQELDRLLHQNPQVTHVAAVHCETTSGMLNPIESLGRVVDDHQRSFIVDAMSSFGGMEMTMSSLSADFLISSANKCVQGVPGFSFVIARRAALEASRGLARSLALDLYDQWDVMEHNHGKWRFTSPTHTVLAFARALDELQAEGGVAARQQRYINNQRHLVEGMAGLGFIPLLAREHHSPIITSFHDPVADFDFSTFYDRLKQRGFVIYPGKVTQADTFRIGNIGDVHQDDIDRLLVAVSEVAEEMELLTPGPSSSLQGPR